LARIAQIYLHLAVHNTQYRAAYVHVTRSFFNRLPERSPVLSRTIHETRYWAAANRHMDALISGSGIIKVLEIHFSRFKNTGSWVHNPSRACFQPDSRTFSCGILSLISCVSIVHRQAILPTAVNGDFAQNVTEGILENKQLYPTHSKLHIPCTQLLVLFCPKSFVEKVLDHLIHDLCEILVGEENVSENSHTDDLPDPFHNCEVATQDVCSGQQRQMNETALFFSIEHMTNQPDVCKTLDNYFALTPCLHQIVSAGIALAIKQQLLRPLEDTTLCPEMPNMKVQTHMNICGVVQNIIRRCTNITESEIECILEYIQQMANAKLLSMMSYSVVSLLTRLIFLYSDIQQSFPAILLVNLVQLLRDTIISTGIGLCNEEILAVVAECVVCIIAKQQTQMRCATWDAVAVICLQQLTQKRDTNKPLSDHLVESLIVSVRHVSLATFKVVLESMKGIFEGFGSVACMSTRRQRQFIDMLKIPLCRGVVLPKPILQEQFHHSRIVQHAEAFAILLCKLDNKSGRHTHSMLSVAHTLFLLALFLETGYSNKDLTLRLCAKIIVATNLKDVQRIRTYTIIVELLGRYHCHIPFSPPRVLISMCPVLIRHLVSTFIPPLTKISYTDVPLQLCIISSVLSHGRLLCLCENAHEGGGTGALACNDIYFFCAHVFANISQMSQSAVHCHGLLLAQRILHRLLRSPFHCRSPLVSQKVQQSLLVNLDTMNKLLFAKPAIFPVSAYADGVADNKAIRSFLTVSNVPFK